MCIKGNKKPPINVCTLYALHIRDSGKLLSAQLVKVDKAFKSDHRHSSNPGKGFETFLGVTYPRAFLTAQCINVEIINGEKCNELQESII